MSIRLAKRREGVVALTHTEIMLVLATIILLLLLAKNFDLTNAKVELAEEREKVSVLEEQASESASEALERKEQADFAREVKAILVQGGVAEENTEPARLAEAVSVLVAEKRRGEARDAAVDEALTQAGMLEEVRDDSESGVAEKIERMGKNAAVGAAARQALGDDEADADSVKERISELKETERKFAELDGKQPTDEERRISDLKSKIGCLPCWLGSGKRKYYYAYDITYHADTNSFGVKPSRDWKRGAEIVDGALGGELSVLKNHPRGLMTSDEFLAFSRRIAAHKNRLHGGECHLMATINKNRVDGNVIEFVRDKVGFCPIYR